MTTSQTTCRLDLSGRWRLEGTNEKGDALSCPAAVPGDVHSALLAAGLMPDPFWGCNERDVQWVGQREWEFRREFEVPEGFLAHSSVILRLEDCDTFATVFVNGAKAGETRDRFRRWDFDVRAALRPGRNEIRLVFDSAWRRGDALAAASPRPYPMSNAETAWFNNGAFIRKPACHRGWDWGLAQMTTGPCGAVALVASDGGRIDYVYSTQEFNDDLSHCTLRVTAEFEGGRRAESVINIDNPPLWWPAGQGEQKFFHYAVPIGDGVVKGRVGLRKLEIDTDGGAVCFKVNNRPVFMKGANWIPCDAFDSRQTPGRYRDLLQAARDANMNMIRLWGGGQFEKDCFYDICDELGLLVWHDFMFSCAVYPAGDAFLADVRAETVHQVKRLRDHACIALWCGDNECIGAARGWYQDQIPDSERPSYIGECRRRFEVQAGAVAEADPTRRFWPSSPCAGEADFEHDAWHDDSRGDMHCWTVWAENAPFATYRTYRPRFCSEFGFQSFPSREVAETFCHLPPAGLAPGAPAPGEDFEWHQKNIGGNQRIRATMARYFAPPRALDEEFFLSQVQQAIAIKTAVEAWRTLRPHCMGTLYWQLNDLWPVSSWSSVEYGGKWKHLHYHARRFYAPVAIVANPSPDGEALVLTALNDTPEPIEADIRVRLLDFAGNQISEETLRRTGVSALQPGSATAIATRLLSAYGAEDARKGRFLVLELSVRGESGACHRND
ncbi:MAG: glycoside hydrolase family 2 protein, partial [Kiritimatiellae bacterium]|nr:glycoside hydrolase family 2 protein [Kiritimatiellia bacterium]